jgi:hypothetical protein
VSAIEIALRQPIAAKRCAPCRIAAAIWLRLDDAPDRSRIKHGNFAIACSNLNLQAYWLRIIQLSFISLKL